MITRCPVCGTSNSLESLLAQDDAAQAINAALLSCPINRSLLLSYLSLFRPEKTKLTWQRLAKLLEALLPLIKENVLAFDGKTHATTPMDWEDGMNRVIQARDVGRLKTPLDNHNYLFKIVIDLAGKAKAAPSAVSDPSAIAVSAPLHTPVSSARLGGMSALEARRQKALQGAQGTNHE